jgi:hypothetical protein
MAKPRICIICRPLAAASRSQFDNRMRNMGQPGAEHVVPYECAACGSTDWAYSLIENEEAPGG